MQSREGSAARGAGLLREQKHAEPFVAEEDRSVKKNPKTSGVPRNWRQREPAVVIANLPPDKDTSWKTRVLKILSGAV